MASPFKIPKKKQPAGSDSADLHIQSPLSRLQSAAPQHKSSFGEHSSRGRTDRVHAGNSLGSSPSSPRKPFFREVVKTLLGLNSPNKGETTANHRAAGSWSRQSQPAQRAESSSTCFSNGWRPKRASDRLLAPNPTSEQLSPPQKKRSDLSAEGSFTRCISVESVDLLAELRGEEHAGSLSFDPTKRKSAGGSSSASLKQQQKKNDPCLSDPSSEDEFASPPRTKPPADASPLGGACRPFSSGGGGTPRAASSSSSDLRDDPQEKVRRRWKEFRERKTPSRSAVLQRRLRKPTTTEPIVLSSEEEEEEGDEDGVSGTKELHSSSRVEAPRPWSSEQKQACKQQPDPRWDQDVFTDASLPSQVSPSDGETDELPSVVQLEFSSLHVGLTHADASGAMMITDIGISIPLKVVSALGAEQEEVTVVASQVRGYGVWDGALAQDGSLLAGRRGPAPSLLFLWVTDAQANLLHTELSSSHASGPPCCFLLLVLKEQLQELQAALLASILDLEEYRKGRSSFSSSPLEWTDGLLLLHSCPPPLDQHLLGLLGCSPEKTSRDRSRRPGLTSSSGLQQLPTRLIQYPPPPSRGRITVSKEDLACLTEGEFLNDVIIDFYLKYVLLEGVGGAAAERSHVFSSFFYKQLSRRRAAGESDGPSVPDRHMRHQRVKTWTRHVDIFTKDFLFVPVNQEAHWYLVVVCFPGLDDVQYQKFHADGSGSERPAGKPPVGLRSQQPPECLQQSCRRGTVMRRPCILVMDSLKLSYHENVCRLLRDYLQVEWEVRRGTPRLFTPDSCRSSSCRVPQQDNSSDCGVYLLQYAESFLQNPVVHFDLPVRLEGWFPRQRVRQKRSEIRGLIMKMHRSQSDGPKTQRVVNAPVQ